MPRFVTVKTCFFAIIHCTIARFSVKTVVLFSIIIKNSNILNIAAFGNTVIDFSCELLQVYTTQGIS